MGLMGLQLLGWGYDSMGHSLANHVRRVETCATSSYATVCARSTGRDAVRCSGCVLTRVYPYSNVFPILSLHLPVFLAISFETANSGYELHVNRLNRHC